MTDQLISELYPELGLIAFLHSPSSALQTSVQVREGDMVLLSSDGLFNNVYEEEILKVLKDVQVHACTYVCALLNSFIGLKAVHDLGSCWPPPCISVALD